MPYWTEEQINGINKMLWENEKRIQKQLEHEREMAQFKAEILAECKQMIEQIVPQRVDIVIKDNATPKLQEIDKAIKNLGHM